MDTVGLVEKVDDESEWEYETHPTETETLYVTLDLAHNPNNIFRDRGPSAFDGVSLKGRPVLQSVKVPDRPQVRSVEDQEFSGSRDTVQILDLHTRNPLISYRSKIYSCNWMNTLGTDLHFVQTPSASIAEAQTATNAYKNKNLLTEPLLQDNGWALLGTNSTKLVGHPVRPVPKDATVPNHAGLHSTQGRRHNMAPSVGEGNGGNNSETDVSMRPVKISLGATATHSRQSSARFLEQLISIKQARGEADRVPLGSRTYEQIWRSEDKERQRNVVEGQVEGFHPEVVESQPRHNILLDSEAEHKLPDTSNNGNDPANNQQELPEDISNFWSKALTKQGSKGRRPYSRGTSNSRRPRGRRPRPFAWQLSGATGIDPNAVGDIEPSSCDVTVAPVDRNNSAIDHLSMIVGEGEGVNPFTKTT